MPRILLVLIFLSVYNWSVPQQLSDFSRNASFIENKGQIIDQNRSPNNNVLFLLNSPGFNVQLRKGGFSYDLYSRIDSAGKKIQHFHRIDIDLEAADKECNIITSDLLPEVTNYYGDYAPDGISSVRSFKKIIYQNIYPEVDLEFSLDQGQFEYNFIIRPGGSLASINLKIEGADCIEETPKGLLLTATVADIDENIPGCFYLLNDQKVTFNCSFIKQEKNIYALQPDIEIPDNALVLIDPVPTRRWGTYYGGSAWDSPSSNGSFINSQGELILGGYTGSSNNIATIGAFIQYFVPGNGIADGFIAKFSSAGFPIWATYYAGNVGAVINGIALDKYDNIIGVGLTYATSGLATPGVFQTVLHGENDGFVVKFNTSGQRLWATYYGGNEDPYDKRDNLEACAVDTNGFIYCAGETTSSDFISTPGSHQPTKSGNWDATLVKFTPDGQRVWGTYYGGIHIEQNICVSVTKYGKIFLSGSTASSSNIATPGAFLTTLLPGNPAFLACFNPDGQRQWGTYFCGALSYGNAPDTGRCVYLYGIANQNPLAATPGTFQTTYNVGECNSYIEKFSDTGTRIWGTFVGGDDEIFDAAVDDSGFVYVVGHAYSQNPAICSPEGYMGKFRGGFTDGYFGKFSGTGQRIWSSYYGGKDQDHISTVAVDNADNIYIAGYTYSENQTNNTSDPCRKEFLANVIATQNSHQQEKGGQVDAFLVKFHDCYSPDTALVINGPEILCSNSSGNVYWIPPIPAAAEYRWCVTGGLTITSGQNSTSITVSAGSSHGRDTISVYGINACDTGFPKRREISLISRPIPVFFFDDTTCSGIQNVYSTNSGFSNYLWSISPGGIIVSGGTPFDTSCTVVWNTPGNRWVRLNYTDVHGCSAVNATQSDIFVLPGVIVNVSVNTSATDVCTGTLVDFMASGTGGGSSPIYQWEVNGIDAGTNSNLFSYSPSNGDIIKCIFTSSVTGCVSYNPDTSNSITMVVNPMLPVSVNISTAQTSVCAGTPVTFNALPTNEGSLPFYQWQVNGINTGTNQNTFTFTPINNDVVQCSLTSNATCETGSPAPSNLVTMTVNPNLAVTLTLSASNNPVCAGIPVTFTATPGNGGFTPVYQWKVNGINAGTNANQYTYPPNNGDIISCSLTTSLSCALPLTAAAIPITMAISPKPVVSYSICTDSITTTNAKPFTLKGGLPLGGTYSGPGVNSSTSIFTPSIAGVGTKTISYSYTNAGLCSNAKTKNIIVQTPAAFTCGNSFKDIRDNQIYQTVQIGIQCWFAENLDYGREITSNQHQRDNCVSEKYSYVVTPLRRYAYYQWDELMQYTETSGDKGLCPPSWHIPAEAEWNTLFNFYLSIAFAGNPLKYSGYSGFDALLSGANHQNHKWNYPGFATFFWSSTPNGPYKAWAHGLNEYDPSVSTYSSSRANAFSVRCLKD